MTSAVKSMWENVMSTTSQSQTEELKDFQKIVRKYNPEAVQNTHGFAGLKSCLNQMETDERHRFFQSDLPGITRLASDLNRMVTCAPPLMRAGWNSCVSLSQHQVACLLANAFMCTFPDRNGTGSYGRTTFPDFNFDRMFEPTGDASRARQKTEKLKCLLNYFKRVTGTPPCGTLTITRRTIERKTENFWRNSHKPLLENVHISATGSIEEDGSAVQQVQQQVQVDFANKYIGGGVLGNGLVQEEIRFLKFPELIITRLLCERMEDNEAILIIGAERYNTCEGYASSFKWAGDFRDETPWDDYRRKECQIVAMDAMDFGRDRESQYQLRNVLRELNKAYAGFRPFSTYPTIGGEELPGVATGNWGCGAFKGDPHLKFLIQLMAVSEVERKRMSYFTYMNDQLASDLHRMHTFLRDKSVTVGRLFMILESYSQLRPHSRETSVFQFVHGQLSSGDHAQKSHSDAAASASRNHWTSRSNEKEQPSNSGGSHQQDCRLHTKETTQSSPCDPASGGHPMPESSLKSPTDDDQAERQGAKRRVRFKRPTDAGKGESAGGAVSSTKKPCYQSLDVHMMDQHGECNPVPAQDLHGPHGSDN